MQYLKHSTLILFAIFVIFFSADAKSPKRTFQSEAIFPLQSQHCHGSTLVELPNHDLLCAWFQGSGERTSDDVVIKGSRYNHKKGQWSEPFLMADVPDFPDINPVLFLDGDKHLWLVWYTVMAYQWSTSLLKYRISEDYMQKNGPPVWKWQDVLHVKADGSPTAGIGQKDSFALKVEKKFDAYIRYLENKGDIREDGRYFTRKELEKARQLYSGLVRGNNLQSDGKETNEEGKSVSKKLGYPLMRRIGWQTRNKPLITDHRILLPLYSDGLNLSLMAITEDEGMHWQFSDPILGGGA
ncbi:MAG: exo-alpha-sialidase, partial [Marinilabiliales bacterium]|nr:exo-alpha-sialidase [Marinilabiliales bacterium]